jgi:DNA (cytosine-5)-methyltransferase 1
VVRPVIVDLYCGEGGAGAGYARAGFDVIGVDLVTFDRYPFPFVRGDALRPPLRLDLVAAVHASPPCQAHTTARARDRDRLHLFELWSDLLTPTLALLEDLAVPWIVENVPGAVSLMPPDPLVLHGGMFGLGVYRPRLFASNVDLVAPDPAPRPADPVAVYGKRPDGRWTWKRADGTRQHAARSVEEAGAAMGIDWMGWRGLCEAIPPAYTEWIGRQLLPLAR